MDGGVKRREVPLIGMSETGREELRRQGFVALPFSRSMTLEPGRLSPHYHSFYQISLLHGPCRVMHDFREAEVEGRTLLFLSPGQVHTVRPAPGTDGTILSFTREFLGAAGGNPGGLPFFHASRALPWASVPEEDAPRFARLFAELQEEFDRAAPGAAGLLRALLEVLLIRAGRLYDTAEPASAGSGGHRLVRQFQQLVEERFQEWQGLAPYAKALGVTANHLNDVVREATGSAAGSLIRARRLLDAKRLLMHSDLSISEVGYRLGFRDPSYFSRFFRRYESATPAEFRSRIREKYQHDGESHRAGELPGGDGG